MTLTFKYKSVKRPDGTTVKIPAVPIRLHGRETFDTIGLLDSGADISAIPQEIAEILGLKLDGKRGKAYGIGGEVDSVEVSVNISIERAHEHYSFKVPFKVILSKYDFPIILGRLGFFDKFIIIFNQSQEKVSLKKTGNPAEY